MSVPPYAASPRLWDEGRACFGRPSAAGLSRGSRLGEPPAPDWEGALDWQGAQEQMDGDADLLSALMELYATDCPPLVAELREAVEQRDCPALVAAAHKLRGMLSNFHAGPASDASLLLERMGRTGDLAGAERGVLSLERELERLAPALDALREEMGQ